MSYEEGGITLCDVPGAIDRAMEVGFDFDRVYDDLDGPEKDPASPDPMFAASEAVRLLFAWVYQPPCKDQEGFYCRAIIACWIFVPQLRSYTMTEMAGRFGKKKQSLGRWVEDFKREFPEVTRYMQHIKH